MNNPNPFVPKGSLLEQQSLRRSRLKIAVGCALAVSVTGLVVMLIQGCKREQPNPDANLTPPADTNVAAITNSNPPPLDNSSNPPVAVTSNSAPAPVPVPTPAPVTPTMLPPVEPTAGAEYVVVQGDTLAKIAKANGVTLKALEAANPGVDPKKLKIKQKLVIPPRSAEAATGAPSAAPGATDTGGAGGIYTVKSGDTLIRIAKRNGISVKSLRAANNLSTDHIKVGQKLTIPAKAEAAAAPAPTPDTSTAPTAPPPSNPAPVAPSPAPGPGH
ncbi:MAG TPA: LysM peptidoglycan-binding domain-containing protein [Candidatus Acidoferrales bacterium]|nr:LysM peptidoglycan-binding domain-containing protein [Candidatus Acidoferrales bacterium]